MALALDLERRLDISPAALAFGLRVLAEPGVRAQVAELGRRIGRVPPPPGSALEFEKERALRLLSMGQRPAGQRRLAGAPPSPAPGASSSPPSPRTTHTLPPPLAHRHSPSPTPQVTRPRPRPLRHADGHPPARPLAASPPVSPVTLAPPATFHVTVRRSGQNDPLAHARVESALAMINWPGWCGPRIGLGAGGGGGAPRGWPGR